MDWVPTSAGQILIVAFSGAQALIELRLLGMGRYVSKRGVDPLLSTDRLFIAGWATKTPIPITLYILPIYSAHPLLHPLFPFFFLFSLLFSLLFSSLCLFERQDRRAKFAPLGMARYSTPRIPRIASNVIVVTLQPFHSIRRVTIQRFCRRNVISMNRRSNTVSIAISLLKIETLLRFDDKFENNRVE